MQRLLYISRATGLWTETLSADVAAIAISCTHYNFGHGITGVLAFRNGYFMQLLEGDRKSIKALFARIGADKRHDKMTVLAVESGDDREFVHWSFRLSPASDLGRPFKSFIERHWATIERKHDADLLAELGVELDSQLVGLNAPSTKPQAELSKEEEDALNEMDIESEKDEKKE